jgi:hypothetical protein
MAVTHHVRLVAAGASSIIIIDQDIDLLIEAS